MQDGDGLAAVTRDGDPRDVRVEGIEAPGADARLVEAAEVDGATRWQRFRLVVMPLVAPALLPSVVLGSVWTFNMFNVVFLVSGGEPDGQTDILVSEAYRWAFTRQAQYGYAAAYSVLIFLLLMFGTRIPAALGALPRRRANNRAALATTHHNPADP